MRVSGSLVMCLRFGNRKFEFLVKFIQIDNKVTSSRRGKVSFRVDSQVGVVACVSKEW